MGLRYSHCIGRQYTYLFQDYSEEVFIFMLFSAKYLQFFPSFPLSYYIMIGTFSGGTVVCRFYRLYGLGC